ncbi:Sec7 domain-containing protein [Scheffersomyces coipomensis]|uniref:Sec7 domain-containing protein n=1 Tax=Scheffersomyces coipomensis TaxID=1788519 RepID=UPI00315D807A
MTPPRTPTHSIHSEEVKLSPQNDENDYKSIATKLFNETFISIQPEEYTQFLSGTENDSEKIRDYYMNLFDWDLNILTSIRTLCSKLYLKGESQELDRILTSFTKAYLIQFPKNNFYTSNFEQIYIIIYSIILLNTSLHNNLDLKKISQTDFIKNTLTTFLHQDSSLKLSIKQRIVIEQELSKIYDDLLKHELQLKGTPQSDKNNNNNNSADNNNTNGDNQLTRHPTNGSGSIWSTDAPNNNNNNNNNNNIFGSRKLSNAAKRLSSLSSNHHPLPQPPHVNASSVSVNTSGQTSMNPSMAPSTNTNNAARAGFRSALMTDQAIKGLRNRQSMDHLRNMHSGQNHPLYRKSSRSSIISRDSTNSNYVNSGDDTISMISVDSKFKQLINSNQNNTTNDYDFNNHFDDTMSIGEEIENFNIENYQDEYDLTLELQGSPYLKEGLLKLKILHNDQQDETSSNAHSNGPSNASITSTSTTRSFFSFFGGNRNSNKREPTNTTTGTSSSLIPMNNKFNENFVVVSKGQLSLYSFDPKIIKKHQQMVRKLKQTQMYNKEEDIDSAIGDGNWLKNAANVGNYNLCSTFAKLEKSIHNTQPSGKTYVWSLSFPRISNKKSFKKFLFEAGTKEIALEFINTCNFWASKITAIPTLEESVSSIEYGWTNLDYLIQQRVNFKKSKNIMKYESLPRGIYLTNSSNNNYGLMKQFGKTLNYYNNLKNLYQEFLSMKQRFLKNFPIKQFNGSNYSRIIHNYDLKIEDYKEELNKYKNYLILIGFGLQLRFDLETEQKEEEKEESKQQQSDEQTQEVEEEEEDEDDELTTMVKFEIKKLFFNMKDIGNIIPTFEASKTISGLALLDHEQFIKNFNPLVKSPKNFTLSNFKDTESPIQQLLSSSSNGNHPGEISNSHSTSTIKEEDEDAEEEELGDIKDLEKIDTETKVETPNLSTDSFQIIKEPATAMRVRVFGGAVLV